LKSLAGSAIHADAVGAWIDGLVAVGPGESLATETGVGLSGAHGILAHSPIRTSDGNTVFRVDFTLKSGEAKGTAALETSPDIGTGAGIETGLAGTLIFHVLTLGTGEAGETPANRPMARHLAPPPIQAEIQRTDHFVTRCGVHVGRVSGHSAFLTSLGRRHQTDEIQRTAGAGCQSRRGILTRHTLWSAFLDATRS
jgi:hypothetical protein